MAKTLGTESYGLDPTFERTVAALACCRPRFYGRVGRAVDAARLAVPEAKLAMEAAHAIARDTGAGPASMLIVVQRLRRLVTEGKITLEQVIAVSDMFDVADDAGLPDDVAVAEELVPVLKRQMQADAVRASMEEYAKRGDFARVSKLLSEAAQLGVANGSAGVNIGGKRMGAEAFEALRRLRSLSRLPTGIQELDAHLEGGLQQGGLGVFIGSAGAGKSMALSHVAADALTNGLHVVYATLELPEAVVLARIMANLTGMPIAKLLNGGGDHAQAVLGDMLLGPGCIKEFSPHATTVDELKDWVKCCADAEGRAVDLLVVDYADKLIVAQKSTPDYQAMRMVYEGLRIFVDDEKFWCWTASQSKGRDKDEKKRLDLEHVADSMHKVRVADLVVTLNAHGERAEEMSYFVAKHRTGQSRVTAGPLPTNFACGQVCPVVR